jgi:hypothetical protein
MARSLTNNLGMAVSIEASIGALPATPLWVDLEPNSVGAYGPEITTVPRNPISNTRQAQKGSVTDKDSSVEWEGDLTKHHTQQFMEGFIFASRQSPDEIARVQAGADYDTLAATGTDDFTHTALGAAILDGSLLFARGFSNAANNGLFESDVANTTTNTNLAGTPGTVVETPATTTGARVDVCGFRITDGTWTDATNTFGSTLTDLSSLGLVAGQMVRVGIFGGNAFTNGSVVGRIVGTPTAASFVLDKVENLGAGTLDGGGDETSTAVDLLFGPFIKNVAVSDANFLEQSFQFELAYADLDSVGTDEYEYAIGNLCNEVVLNMPGQDKATMAFNFIGTDSDVITTTRKGNAANRVQAVQKAAFNTAASFARLNLWTTAEVDLATCFKSLTLTIANEVSPEKCLGTLGATFMNTGNLAVSLEAELLFTDSALATGIVNNDTVTFDFLLSNDDGAIALDLPSLTLGGGAKSFPVNESIKISVTGSTFADATLDTSIGFTEFPYWPAVS